MIDTLLNLLERTTTLESLLPEISQITKEIDTLPTLVERTANLESLLPQMSKRTKDIEDVLPDLAAVARDRKSIDKTLFEIFESIKTNLASTNKQFIIGEKILIDRETINVIFPEILKKTKANAKCIKKLKANTIHLSIIIETDRETNYMNTNQLYESIFYISENVEKLISLQ